MSIYNSPRETSILYGHENAEKLFLDAFHGESLPHAWLISGEKGVGKACLCYAIARYILQFGDVDNMDSLFDADDGGGLFSDDDMAGGDKIPDGQVEPSSHRLYIGDDTPLFKQIAANSHADLTVLEGGMINPDTGKHVQGIPIAAVRKLIEKAHLTAAAGGWRVYIIDSIDDMTISAANALLKILEEPPKKTLFLLTTNQPGKLLPTIKSRCRMVALTPLSLEKMKIFLKENSDIEDDGHLNAIAILSEGIIGRALLLIKGNGLGLYQRIFDILKNGDKEDAMTLSQLLDKPGEEDSFHLFELLLSGILYKLIKQLAGLGNYQEILKGEAQNIMQWMLGGDAVLPTDKQSRQIENWLLLKDIIHENFQTASAPQNISKQQIILLIFNRLHHAIRGEWQAALYQP